MRTEPAAPPLLRRVQPRAPGAAVYGSSPVPARPRTAFEPAHLKTQVVFLATTAAARIGYGGTWRAERPSRIATLPVGYNDGYRFAFSNKAHVLVRGRRAPVVGRVSMDYAMVDVTDIPGVRVDDEATLVGRDGDERIGVADLAGWADTIPYEILCGIGRRVMRTYAEAPVAASGRTDPAENAVPAGAVTPTEDGGRRLAPER